MKNQLRFTLITLLAVLFLVSCKKDEVGSSSGSRDVKYEITGDFSGKFLIAATTNNGVAEILEVEKLPWKLEFTAKASITSLTIIANGTNGKKGEKATLKTYIGGKEVNSGSGTAITDGILSISNVLSSFK
jgi:hypothetical protein